jgi:excinuclease ABC subunit C
VFFHSLELGAGIDSALAAIPPTRGVFALFGADASAEPYISQTANLRRRLQRLLGPRDNSSRRLNLRQRAARVEYSVTGSRLESLLLLYRAYRDPRQRLKLRPPPLLRFAMENAYPRIYLTTRLNIKAAQNFYGPFASRVQAEKYLESALDLFLLRRCQPDLAPDPAFPGCIYSEMHKCLAPCFKGCSDERYAQEAQAVRAFFHTRGESLLKETAAQREAASAALDFEQAAALHDRFEKVKAAAHLAPELARPLSENNAVIVERSAQEESVALFLFTRCRFFGPVEFSTAAMRHGNEQSKSSSLFVQPVQIAPVPLEDSAAPAAAPPSLEERLRDALEQLLRQSRESVPPTSAIAGDHLALLRRWFYRPAAQKSGEMFFAASQPDATELQASGFPLRRILRGVSRVFTGQTASQSEALQSDAEARA